MGQAKLRGDFEQRRAQAIYREELRAEAIQLATALAEREGLNIRRLPREEQKQRVRDAITTILERRRAGPA